VLIAVKDVHILSHILNIFCDAKMLAEVSAFIELFKLDYALREAIP